MNTPKIIKQDERYSNPIVPSTTREIDMLAPFNSEVNERKKARRPINKVSSL